MKHDIKLKERVLTDLVKCDGNPTDIANIARTHGIARSTIYLWAATMAEETGIKVTQNSDHISKETRAALLADFMHTGNVTHTAQKYNVSRQAVSRWLTQLAKEEGFRRTKTGRPRAAGTVTVETPRPLEETPRSAKVLSRPMTPAPKKWGGIYVGQRTGTFSMLKRLGC